MKTPKALFLLVLCLAFAAGPLSAFGDTARLVNISTRMQVLTGDNVMIGGFVISGSVAKTIVVRARGPSLVPTGIANPLLNPTLRLYSGQTVIAENDDYGSASNAAQLQASGFAPSDALESAILITLAPGPYTAIVAGANGTTGVGLIEVFEVDHPEAPFINIATRGKVLTGNDVMIAGFIVQGTGQQTVVVRGRGPSLASQALPGVLTNPTLTLVRSSDGTAIAANDNWQSAANMATLQASGYAPANPAESAILISLDPGAYTAIVSGVGGETGVAIVEVFGIALPPDAQPPEVDTTSPLNTAENMSVLVPVSVTFTEAMDPATLTSSTFLLTGPSGPVTAALSANGNTWTLTPSARLVTSSSYAATVTTGARDLAGNPLASNYSFGFTTRPDEPPPIVAGCPTPPSTSQLRRLEWGDTPKLRRKSGEVTTFRVAQSPSGRASVSFTQGQTAFTPSPANTDLTVSRCPGVIEDNLHPNCRYSTSALNFASITAFNRAMTEFGWTTQDQHPGCLAPNSEQYYVNVRWTFPNCFLGTEQCGFSLQWGEGPY
jgi:hypothetical protein